MLQFTHLPEGNTHFMKQIHGLDGINENKEHFIESQTLEMETYIRTYVPSYRYCVISRNNKFYGRKRDCHCIQQAKLIFLFLKSCHLFFFF